MLRLHAQVQDAIDTIETDEERAHLEYALRALDKLAERHGPTVEFYNRFNSIEPTSGQTSIVTAYNFCEIHSTLGTTLAHGIGSTSEPWTIEQLVDEIGTI